MSTITGPDADERPDGQRRRDVFVPSPPSDELLWPDAVPARPRDELLWPDHHRAVAPDVEVVDVAIPADVSVPAVVTHVAHVEETDDEPYAEVADAEVVDAEVVAAGGLGDLERVLRILAAGTGVGLLLGLLVGGVGGRVAMRLLFLTSGSEVRGLISDDGFPIGRFDLVATLNLLLVGTVLGVIGAFVYLAVRPFLLGPRWLRTLGCAVGAGAVVGSMLVHVEGVDFTRLGPRWFAIALFVALPALFGALVVGVTERALRPDGLFLTARRRVALAPLATFLFPPLLLVLGPPTAVVLLVRRVARRRPGLHRALTHPGTMHAVRVAWVAAGLVGVWTLGADTVELLVHTR